VDTTPDDPTSARPREPLDLAAAHVERQSLILDGPDVADFLYELAVLAAAIVPGTHCGITLRRDGQLATVASSDEVAMQMDELQYLGGRGPCLSAMHEGARIEVPDLSAETRWGDYAGHALSNGVRSVFSLPLTLDGDTRGALNLFAVTPHAFTDADLTRAEAFTRQATTALTILLRHAATRALDDELRDALATRAVIDQALGHPHGHPQDLLPRGVRDPASHLADHEPQGERHRSRAHRDHDRPSARAPAPTHPARLTGTRSRLGVADRLRGVVRPAQAAWSPD
jgi:GAF domain-containing protein